MHIDIRSYQQDHAFYGYFEGLFTIKSFDLKAIRRRYLSTTTDKHQRTGSVERRPVSTGGIVWAAFEGGHMTAHEILCRTPEPRGIAIKNKQLAISSENEVFLISDKASKTIRHDWFSYIHTLDFHPDNNRLLIASSGLDCIIEVDTETLQQTNSWHAWDHGIDEGKDAEGHTLYLTRDEATASALRAKGLPVTLIENPEGKVLPTANRAAFINGAYYDPEDPEDIIATLFHAGEVRCINLESGTHYPVLEGLSCPHGGKRLRNDELMVTNTKKGQVVYITDEEPLIYNFNQLEGKAEGLENMEWLQNSHLYKKYIATFDANRCSLVVFHPEKKRYDKIFMNHNWAVQDFLLMKNVPSDMKSNIKNTFNT